MSYREKLKCEAKALETALLASKSSFAPEAYELLEPYFTAIQSMDDCQLERIGDIRLVRLFLETDLSDDKSLFECYGRFSSLIASVNI
mgnify:CR=1 FL=1|jgi:hypothetical protein